MEIVADLYLMKDISLLCQSRLQLQRWVCVCIKEQRKNVGIAVWARACVHNIVFTCGCNGITTTSASRRAFHLCLGDVTFRLQWWYFHKSKVNSYHSLVWKPLAFHFLLPVHDQQPTHSPNQALMSGPAYRPAFLHGRRGCLRWLAGDGGGGNSFAAMRSQSWHGNGPHLRFSFGDVRTKQTQYKRVW